MVVRGSTWDLTLLGAGSGTLSNDVAHHQQVGLRNVTRKILGVYLADSACADQTDVERVVVHINSKAN